MEFDFESEEHVRLIDASINNIASVTGEGFRSRIAPLRFRGIS